MTIKYSELTLIGLAVALPFKLLVGIAGMSVKISPGDLIVAGVVVLIVVSVLEPVIPKYILHIMGLSIAIFTSLIFVNEASYLASLTEFVKLIGSISWMITIFVILRKNTTTNLWVFSITSVGVSTIISIHSILQRFALTQYRPDSVFVNSNLFSAYLVFNLILLTYIYLSCDDYSMKVILLQLTIAIILILGIFVSGSRSGLAGPFLWSIAFYFYTRDQVSRMYRIAAFAFTSLAGIGYILVNPILLERLMEPITSSGDMGLGKRLVLWSNGLSAWLNSPITGMGYNQFELVFNTDVGLHNTYLVYLVETGVFGLVMFLGVVLTPLIDAVRYARYDMRISLFGVYIVFLLIHGLFHGIDNYRTLWISIGIIAAISTIDHSEIDSLRNSSQDGNTMNQNDY